MKKRRKNTSRSSHEYIMIYNNKISNGGSLRKTNKQTKRKIIK